MHASNHKSAQLVFVNLITFSRLLAGTLSVLAFPAEHAPVYLAALYAYILLSDIADGALARRWRVSTNAGSIFDYTVDYFNGYLQIALLVSVGVPVWIFTAFMFRDLLYVFWRVYARFEKESGVRSLTLIGTAGTYFYVLYLAADFSREQIFETGLFIVFLISLTNLLWRLGRLRSYVVQQIRNELTLD